MPPDAFSAADLIGSVVDDRFEVLEKLGEGGMGAIYKARQISMDRIVALKILLHDQRGDPISVERFRHEAYLASRLKHPNAIIIHDFGQTGDGLLYIAMEFLPGETVKERCRKVGPLPVNAAVKIMTQVVRTIGEAHRMGLIHRDLKPDNIFLTEQDGDTDFAKVLDFGIAKLTAVQDGLDGYQGGLTMQGKIYGTPNYMSPEQIRGKDVDHQSDLYALGVIFHELLAGKVPFSAETPVEVMMKHLRDPPPSITAERPSVPIELERVVARALEKDRRSRYSSADELLEAIENYKFNSGFYAVPARLAVRASMTDTGRAPSGGDAPDDSEDGLNATMMLQSGADLVAPEPNVLDGFEYDDDSFDDSDSTMMGADLDEDEKTVMEFGGGDEPDASPFGGGGSPFGAQPAHALPAPVPISSTPAPAVPVASALPVVADSTPASMVKASPAINPFRAAASVPAARLPRSIKPVSMPTPRVPSVPELPAVPVLPLPVAKPAPRASNPFGEAPDAGLLELDDDEFEEVEPSRLMPIPDALSPPKRTMFGAPGSGSPPIPRATPPRHGPPGVPAAVPATPARPGRPVAPKRTLAGHPGAPVVARAAPAQPAQIVASARPTLNQPVGGKEGGGRTILLLGVLLVLVIGVVAVVVLDPFAKPVEQTVVVGPPKVSVSSASAAVEVFDHGRYVGDSPMAFELEAGTTDLDLRLVTDGDRVFKVKVAPGEGQSWLHLRLPKDKQELGLARVVAEGESAVKIDGKVVGQTPLIIVGLLGAELNLTVESGGSSVQKRLKLVAKLGELPVTP